MDMPEFLKGVDVDANTLDRRITRDVIGMFYLARGSISEDKLKQAKISRRYWIQGATPRNMKSGTDYVTGADLDFSLVKRDDGVFTKSTTQLTNPVVVTHVGIALNYTVQIATLAEVLNLARVKIYQASSDWRDIEVSPLAIFFNPIKDWGTRTGTTDAGESLPSSFAQMESMLYELPRPLAIPAEESGNLVISGLTGTIAGSTPLLTMLPVTMGWEILLN